LTLWPNPDILLSTLEEEMTEQEKNLVRILERTLALAIGHACEARKINEEEAETWPWVKYAREAIEDAKKD
jgi:hypothetical protein